MITVRAPSGDKAVAAITVRTPTGDKAVERMTLRTPSGDKLIYAAGGMSLTVTASPASAVGSGANASPIAVTSAVVTASASGGTGPYTYAWTELTMGTAIEALSPSSAATQFRATVAAGESEFADFRCTATDARGRTGTVDVSVSLFNFWFGDPI